MEIQPTGGTHPVNVSVPVQSNSDDEAKNKLGQWVDLLLQQGAITPTQHFDLQSQLSTQANTQADLVQWANIVYSALPHAAEAPPLLQSGPSQSLEAASGSNALETTSDPSTPFGPPPADAPQAVKDIYNQLSNLGFYSNQDWFKNWCGGANPTSPADLSKEVATLNQAIQTLKQQGVSDTDPQSPLAQMEALLKQDQQLLSAYQGLSTQTFTGSNGFTFQLQDTILGNTQGTPGFNLLTTYNQAIGGDPKAIATLQQFVSAFTDNKAQINNAISQANTDKSQLMNDLFDPSSNIHLFEMEILVANPQLPTTNLDLSFLTNTTGATYLWAHINPALVTNESAWTSFFTSPPQSLSDVTAQQLSSTITGVFRIDLNNAYTTMVKTPGTPAQILDGLRAASALSQAPSQYTHTEMEQLTYVVSALYINPNAPAGTIDKLTDQINSYQDQIGTLDYALANDYATLEKYKQTGDATKITALETQIQSTLKDVSAAKGHLGSLLAQGNQMNAQVTTTITDSIQKVLNGSFDQKAFDAQVTNFTQTAQTLANSSDYTQVSQTIDQAQTLVKGATTSSSLVNQVIAATNGQAAPVGQGDDLAFPNALGGDGIWFDVSRVLTGITSQSDFVSSLDKYFSECMRGGVSELKLSFGQLNGGGSANTLQTLFDQFGGSTSTMHTILSEAQKYGLQIGVSMGGEDASGSMLTIPNGDGKAFADTLFPLLIDNSSSPPITCKSIDFDLEGAGLQAFVNNNSQSSVSAFFAELHTLAAAKGIQVQMTLCGSVHTNAGPLTFVFQQKPCPIDSINIMAYNNGAGYYLSTTNPDYGSVAWMNFLVTNAGISPTQAMQMLSFDYEDVTPYNNTTIAVTQDDPWAQGTDAEVFTRTGKHLYEMSPGAAATEIVKQLQIDTIVEWNKQNPSNPVDPNTEFATSNWWVDSNRAQINGPLNPSPEAQAAAQALESTYSLPF